MRFRRRRQPHWQVSALILGLVLGAGFVLVSTRPAPVAEAVETSVSGPPPQPVAGLRGREPVAPYRNCNAARAAGAAPVYANDPRYAPWLDHDADGIGCEPYYGP